MVLTIPPDHSGDSSDPASSVGPNGGNFIFDSVDAEVGHEISKTFIEPEIVPPLHSDKVSEPVMSTLMGNDNSQLYHFFDRYYFLIEVGIIESDDSWVFHGAGRKLMAKDSVVFGEGIVHLKLAHEKLDGQLVDFEDKIFVHVQSVFVGLQTVDAHGNALKIGKEVHCILELNWQSLSSIDQLPNNRGR